MQLDARIAKKFSAALKGRGVFDLTKNLVKKFPKAEVFLVGGAVRDIILDRSLKDIDILARGVRMADLQKALGKLGKVGLVGKRFGVLKFTPKTGESPPRQIDIALPRTDFSFGTGVYKDFKIKYNPGLPIEKDLERRDFTINAMAYDIAHNQLIDPFGGLTDLEKRMIRAVGRPEERFGEDYSRMLRAIRFAMQLGFKIDAKTWLSIKKYIKRINDSVFVSGRSERKVPYEVIAAEFLKSFSSAPAETIGMYDRAGALRALMPEILAMKKCGQPKEFHSEGNVLKHTLLALENLNSKLFKKYFGEPAALMTKIAVLLHDVGKPAAKKKIDGRTVFYNHDKIGADIAKKFLERMKLSAPPEIGIYADEVVWLVENHLLFFYAPPEAMRKTTLEKYLFHKNFSGRAHLELFLADALATKPLRQPVDLKRFKSAYKLWKSLQEKKTEVPPKPLLDGNEVMRILNIAPGPKVGKVLELLREEQLRGRSKDKKSAAQFLKKIL